MAEDANYANPDRLVTTAWVDEHKNDPGIRIVESDEDVLLYETGHIPGAVEDRLARGPARSRSATTSTQHGFEQLCAAKGIDNDTTVVFYGDKNNWWACYAFWVSATSATKRQDHGRWPEQVGDEGREMTRDVPSSRQRSTRPERARDCAPSATMSSSTSATRAQQTGDGKPLVDVRSPGEYSGELLHMPDYPQEGALRGGHIPGAAASPGRRAVNEDGTFKTAEELASSTSATGHHRRQGHRRLLPHRRAIVSHTWFVLHDLLGYQNVRNYDGSWTEWGNVVGVPIEQ